MWSYAYYALFKFKMMPWEWAALTTRQKAALMAMIEIRIEAEKEATKQ